MYVFLCKPVIHILEKTKRKRFRTCTYPAKNFVQKEHDQICPISWRLPVLLAEASKKMAIIAKGLCYQKHEFD